MATNYDGIETDAFYLASVFFRISEMIQKGCSVSDIERFLVADEGEECLCDVAARVINGNETPEPIDLGPNLRLVSP